MERGDATGGFTLFEVLVALLVFGVVMVGAFTLYAANQDAYREGQSRARVQQNARIAVQAALREIRVAGYDPSGVLALLTSPTPIQSATASSVTFVADVTRDGVLDQVTYRIDGDSLVREFVSWDGTQFPAATASVVADGLGALTFSYFDDATPTNAAIAAPVAASNLGDIRRIRFTLVAEDTSVAGVESFPLIADVRLRN